MRVPVRLFGGAPPLLPRLHMTMLSEGYRCRRGGPNGLLGQNRCRVNSLGALQGTFLCKRGKRPPAFSLRPNENLTFAVAQPEIRGAE